MCVIVCCDNRRATDSEIEKMFTQNPQGAGAAWREGEEVCWQKGLDVGGIKEINAIAPLPYILHFRIQTFGGIHKELCHPFPIMKGVPTELSGRHRGFVLFHNGTWHMWRERGLDAIVRNGIKVPDGKWSDTRAMALMAQLHGNGALEFINEKAILFGPTSIEIYRHEDFTRVDDLLVSNRLWENKGYAVYDHRARYEDAEGWEYMHLVGAGRVKYKTCQYGNCKEDTVYDTKWCAKHQVTCINHKCNKASVMGTDWCVEHQPTCTFNDCNEPQVPKEKFCLKHLINADGKAERVKKAKEEAEAKANEDSGGSSTLVPFRQRTGDVQAGEDKQGKAEGASGEMGTVHKGVSQAVMDGAVTDSIAHAQAIWGRPINPKVIKTPHQELMRLVDAHNGVVQ